MKQGLGEFAMRCFYVWLKAVRAPFFTAAIIPVLVGASLAYRMGRFNLLGLIIALVIVIAAHAGANLLNDYYDALGSDPLNESPTPFSGGSRLIQTGILKRSDYLHGAALAYGISLVTVALAAWLYRNPLILGLGVAGAGLGISYSSAKISGMSRGWGEVAVGVGFGPMAVAGSFLLQANTLTIRAFAAGIPVAFLIMGVLILNEFPDYPADDRAGKRTWIVRTGVESLGVWVYLGVISLAYLTLIIGVVSGLFPVRVLYSCLTIPLAVCIGLKLWRFRRDAARLIPAMAGNIGLHLLTGILICLGFWFK